MKQRDASPALPAACRSGFTTKVAGTELGITEPQPTFSPCYTSTSLVFHPVRGAGRAWGCSSTPLGLVPSWWEELLLPARRGPTFVTRGRFASRARCSPFRPLSGASRTAATRLRPRPRPRPPQMKYAAMLGQKLQQHGTQVWLVNTGWTGGG